jgi:hypothetical protein
VTGFLSLRSVRTRILRSLFSFYHCLLEIVLGPTSSPLLRGFESSFGCFFLSALWSFQGSADSLASLAFLSATAP